MPHGTDIIDAHVALGDELHLHLDTADLLREMDAHGVRLAIARPMGAELAVYNRRGNDRVLHAGPRIRGLASANPWFGAEAVAELERCREAGAVGLYLHPTRQGFMPTSRIAEPLIHVAADANWPVVIHTGSYIQSDVLAVAEIARRHPHITFIADAAGFADMWFELPGLMEAVPNLALCASMIWGRAIANAVKRFGSSRILFGSGQPRESFPAALRRIDRIDLNDADRRAILHDNAAHIFRLNA